MIIGCALLVFNTNGQVSDLDSTHQQPGWLAPTVTAAIWTGSLIAFQPVWYEGKGREPFHFFDDSREWLGMDKIGHVYSAFHLSETVKNLFVANRYSENSAVWIGAAAASAYMTSLEILDGYGTGWGFSWSDVAANTLGSALFLVDERYDCKVDWQLKWWFSPSPFASYNPSVLGSTLPQQVLKDYNGQSYWLTWRPSELNATFWPKWIGVSFGYSISEKILGSPNHVIINQTQLNAYSQYYLSLDLLPDGFQLKKKWLKVVTFPLQWIKIPFPGIEFSKHGIRARWLAF